MEQLRKIKNGPRIGPFGQSVSVGQSPTKSTGLSRFLFPTTHHETHQGKTGQREPVVSGSGTGAASPEKVGLSKRWFPELLLYATVTPPESAADA